MYLLSASATIIGLLWYTAPSTNSLLLFFGRNDLKYGGAAEVARALIDVQLARGEQPDAHKSLSKITKSHVVTNGSNEMD